MAALLAMSLGVSAQTNKQMKKVLVVYPFATSGGSSIKKACEDLKAAYPDVNWKDGKLLNRTSKKELETWVKGL